MEKVISMNNERHHLMHSNSPASVFGGRQPSRARAATQNMKIFDAKVKTPKALLKNTRSTKKKNPHHAC